MKRYGHLWEHVIHIDNLWVAYQNARRGKSRYKQIKEFDPLAEQLIPELQAMLIAGDYRTSEYKVFEMFERARCALFMRYLFTLIALFIMQSRRLSHLFGNGH